MYLNTVQLLPSRRLTKNRKILDFALSVMRFCRQRPSIAMFAAFLIFISLLGQAYLAPDMKWVIVWMLTWSTGAHLYMTLKNSICLRLADKGHEGRLLGAIGALESVGILLGMGVVYWGATHLDISFSMIFLIAGICALLASLSMLLIKPIPLKRPEKYL